jgi:hypothetical protein
MEGLAFYILPGVLGAWLAIWLVGVSERYFGKSPTARKLILESAVAVVCAGIGGLAGLALASSFLPMGSSIASLWIALAASVLSAVAGFMTAKTLQARHQDAHMKAS